VSGPAPAAPPDGHARLAALVREAEGLADPGARSVARALVGAVLELHADGLRRMLELATERGDAGRALVDLYARDPMVASLLLLHDLHPVEIEQRVRWALDDLAPRLREQGAWVEPVAVGPEAVRVRLVRGSGACASTGAGLAAAVEAALLDAAPDAHVIEIEEAAADAPAGFVPAERLRVREPRRGA
jgi:hypothetical protein